MSSPFCLLCGGRDSMLVQHGARHDPLCEVRRCAECDLIFLWPRPAAHDLAQYYERDYRAEYGDGPAAERYRADLDEARARVERLVPLVTPDTRMLEIGSGSGAFLDAVRSHVGAVAGVESDADARSWIEGRLGIAVARDLDHVAEVFDVIVLFHVLEHVPDPIRFLRRLSERGTRDVRIVIEVPNVDDALVSLYRLPAYRAFYFQKAHLSYFSARTLARALGEAGLTAEMEGIQRYDLSNHLRWMLTGEPGGHGYYPMLAGARSAYAGALIAAGRTLSGPWRAARRADRGRRRGGPPNKDLSWRDGLPRYPV